MSRFEVIYDEEALAQLVDCHEVAAVPKAVVSASAPVQYRLASDPRSGGLDVLREGLYAVEEGPLRVTFEVREAARTVQIVAVRLHPGHVGWTRPGASGPR